MSRPASLDELEGVYDDMIQRNLPISSWRTDVQISLNDMRVCKAIFSYGSWNLQPNPWNRLQKWLEPFLEYGVKYSVSPKDNEGRLHFTFHQLSGFFNKLPDESCIPNKSKFKEFMNEINGLKIEFRGLLITPTGLALRGYLVDDIQLNKLMRLRDSLGEYCKNEGIDYTPPYVNNIVHSTLFRWIRPLPDLLAKKLQTDLTKWDECWFGSCQMSEWYYGHGTLLMRSPNVIEILCVNTPTIIAHRGLTTGPDKSLENNIEIIKKRAEVGLYSEIDVWLVDNKWFVGHDTPDTSIDLEHLMNYAKYLWIHAKNKEAFEELTLLRKEGCDLCLFWHTTEDYCFTSNLDVIVYPGKPLIENSVFMMPENSHGIEINTTITHICSDY
jgi:hypothetical protein